MDSPESFLRGRITLPLFDSTDAAFFLLSVTSAPAMVVTTVEGGMCRSPGPSFNVFRFPVPVGSACGGISSPGSTSVAIVAIICEEAWCTCYVRVDEVNVSRRGYAGPGAT